MTSRYFSDEPTCRRCDYPRRLHHLLCVEHAYEPRDRDAPAAESGCCTTRSDEGTNRTQKRTDSRMTVPIANRASKLHDTDGGSTYPERASAYADELYFAELAAVDIGDRLRLTLHRLDTVTPASKDVSTEYFVGIDKPTDVLDHPEVHPELIPALIDELTVIYRQWRDIAALEGEL